jgi:hypothetical protein
MSEPENATIIAFPDEKIVRRPVLDDYMDELKEKGKFNFADSLTDELMSPLIESLHNVGVDITSEAFIKDISLATSILRAAIFRNFGLEHSMHNFIDEFVQIGSIDTDISVDTEKK